MGGCHRIADLSAGITGYDEGRISVDLKAGMTILLSSCPWRHSAHCLLILDVQKHTDKSKLTRNKLGTIMILFLWESMIMFSGSSYDYFLVLIIPQSLKQEDLCTGP